MTGNVIEMETRYWKISFDAAAGRLSAAGQDGQSPAIKGAPVSLNYSAGKRKKVAALFGGGRISSSDLPLDDVHGKGRQHRFRSTGREDGLEMVFILNLYDNRPFMLMRLEITNRSGQGICVHDINLLQAERGCGARISFPGTKQPLDFFKVGWHDWVYSGLLHGKQRDINSLAIMRPFIGRMLYNPGLPIGTARGDFWGEGWGLLSNGVSALLAGLVSTADQFGVLHVNCMPEAIALTLSSQADGVLLDPGETMHSEWGYLEFVGLPCSDPAANYVEAVARQMKARVPSAPPGAQWTHWYHFFQSITADLFIDNLNSIDRIRETIPFRTVQLDDGYQSAWGDWKACNAKFPLGLAHLSQNIRGKGYVPGLWLAPFVVDPRSKTAVEHPGWLVKDKRGKPIVSGYFYDFYGHALDLTQPAVIEHIRSLLDTIAHEWGYGFVKADFLYAGALPGIRQNAKMTRAQALRKGMVTVRAAIGEETFLLGCGCPFGPAIGLVDAMRIGPDTAPSWTPHLWNVKWATPVIRGEKSIQSLRNNIRHTLNLSTLHRQWWWNDPDCLMVRDYETTLTDAEVRSNLSLVGLSGGLVISSDDLTRLPPERQKLVALLTPLLGDGGRPADLLEREMAEFYILPCEKGDLLWHDAAVFNWGERAADRRLQLSGLGYNEGQEVHIFDFWEHRHWVQQGGDLLLERIPSHGCRLLRVCGVQEGPTLVGDTLHITQGCEIDSWQVKGRELHIRTIDFARKVEGALWLRLPAPMVSASCGGEAIGFVQENDGIYRLPLEFRGRTEVTVKWRDEVSVDGSIQAAPVPIQDFLSVNALPSGGEAAHRRADHA